MLKKLAFIGLAAFALAWPFLPDAVAEFQWKNLTWTGYEKGVSKVFDKVGADTIYANVYENAAPGVEVGDNEPGTCDATSGYRGVLWYDTSGNDSGLKWCNNEDGSYNWDPIAIDQDGDGFSNPIDGTPATAATGYDDPVAYQVTTTYTGADVQFTHTNNTLYYANVGTSGSRNHEDAVAHFICQTNGDDWASSFTTSSVSPNFSIAATTNGDLRANQSIQRYFNFLEEETDRTLSLSGTSTTARTSITGVTCVRTEDT